MAHTRIFTDQGINKLKDLQKALTSLEEKFPRESVTTDAEKNATTTTTTTTSSTPEKVNHKTFPSSKYSQNMKTAMLKIIDILLEHNEVNYFKHEKNQNSLSDQIEVLDNERGTYVPEIFNAESYALACELKALLDSFELEEDITTQARQLLSPIISMSSMLETVKSNIHFSCQLYELFIKIPEHFKEYKAYSNEIREIYYKWIEQVPTLTANTFSEFEKTYIETCQLHLKAIQALPYVRIANDESLVDQEEPYSFRKGDLVISGMRAGLLVIMIGCEKTLNEKLQDKKLTILTTVYDSLSEICQAEEVEKLKEKCDILISQIGAHAATYKLGKHLSVKSLGVTGLFKSVNPDKVKIFNECAKNLSKANIPSTGEKIFFAVEELLNGLFLNKNLAADKKISVGELSKIFNAYIITFLSMRFNDLNERNDDELLKKLKYYREDLGLETKALKVNNKQ